MTSSVQEMSQYGEKQAQEEWVKFNFLLGSNQQLAGGKQSINGVLRR